jgi:hypothetical protein
LPAALGEVEAEAPELADRLAVLWEAVPDWLWLWPEERGAGSVEVEAAEIVEGLTEVVAGI